MPKRGLAGVLMGYIKSDRKPAVAVKSIDLSDKRLGKLIKHQFHYIKNNPKLQSLNLTNNKLVGRLLKRVLTVIDDLPKLTYLNLSGNKIGDKDIRALAAYIKQNKILTTLILDENFITDVGFGEIIKALIHNRTLKIFSIKANFLNSHSQLLLSYAYLNNQIFLETFELSNDEFYKPVFLDPDLLLPSDISLLSAIENSTFLKTMNVGRSIGTNASFIMVCRTLAFTKSIESIRISSISISPSWMRLFVDSVAMNTNVKSISFNNCTIGSESFQILSKADWKLEWITTLSFEDISLKSNQHHFLARLIRSCRSLTTIAINGACDTDTLFQGNIINDAIVAGNLFKISLKSMRDAFCLSDFIDKLNKNRQLKILIMDGSTFFDPMMENLCSKLAENTTIIKLSLGYCRLSDTHIAAVAKAIKVNRTLRDLNLKGPKLNLNSLEILENALAVNFYITELAIDIYDYLYRGNPMYKRLVQKLQDHIDRNNCLLQAFKQEANTTRYLARTLKSNEVEDPTLMSIPPLPREIIHHIIKQTHPIPLLTEDQMDKVIEYGSNKRTLLKNSDDSESKFRSFLFKTGCEGIAKEVDLEMVGGKNLTY